MKLKFKDQSFQTDAVNAVCDLFAGQELSRTTFSLDRERQGSVFNEHGIGNVISLDNKTILANMNETQKKNNLPLTEDIEDRNFCVEMETGERVIIVTGCINALRSRVSGTLVNMIHALLRVIKYNYCKQCMRSKDVLALQY